MTFLRSPKEIFYNPSTGRPLTNGAVRLSMLSSEGLPTDTRVSRVYSLDGTALDNEDGIFPLGADGGGYFDIRVSARVELLAVGYADAADPIAVAAFDHIVLSESTGSDTSSQVTSSDTLDVFGTVSQIGATPSSIGHKSIEDVYYTASRGFRPLLSYDETKARIQDANLPITAYEDIRVFNKDGGISALYRFKAGSKAIAGFASTDVQPPATRFLNVEPGVSEGWADHWDRFDLLVPSSVTTDKLADGAVRSEKIRDSAVGTAKISNGSVTNSKIASNAITYSKIANNAVTNSRIASNAVTGGKIDYESFWAGFRFSGYVQRFRGDTQPFHTWTVPFGNLWKVLINSPDGRPFNDDGTAYLDIGEAGIAGTRFVGLLKPGVTAGVENNVLIGIKKVIAATRIVNVVLSNNVWDLGAAHAEHYRESGLSLKFSGLFYDLNPGAVIRVLTPHQYDFVYIVQMI